MIHLQSNKVPLKRVRFSPDGRHLVATGDRGEVQLWEPDTAECVRPVEPAEYAGLDVVFARDRPWLLGGCAGGIWVWNLATGERRKPLLVPGGRDSQLVTLDPCGLALVHHPMSVDHRTVCWSWEERKTLWRTHHLSAQSTPLVRFSPDGGTMITWDHSGGIRFWDGRAGQVVRHLLGDRDPAPGAAFSRDGQLAAWVAGSRAVVWDVAGLRPVAALSAADYKLKGVAFHPAGDLLATGGNDGVVRLWDIHAHRQQTAFAWDLGPILDVAFSPDGTRAACCGLAGAVVVWDVDG